MNQVNDLTQCVSLYSGHVSSQDWSHLSWMTGYTHPSTSLEECLVPNMLAVFGHLIFEYFVRSRCPFLEFPLNGVCNSLLSAKTPHLYFVRSTALGLLSPVSVEEAVSWVQLHLWLCVPRAYLKVGSCNWSFSRHNTCLWDVQGVALRTHIQR